MRCADCTRLQRSALERLFAGGKILEVSGCDPQTTELDGKP